MTFNDQIIYFCLEFDKWMYTYGYHLEHITKNGIIFFRIETSDHKYYINRIFTEIEIGTIKCIDAFISYHVKEINLLMQFKENKPI